MASETEKYPAKTAKEKIAQNKKRLNLTMDRQFE